MKMRQMMLAVAALAVLTWLAIPAVRIWRDPNLRYHEHAFEWPEATPANVRTAGVDSSTVLNKAPLEQPVRHVSYIHRVEFLRRYAAMLFGRPWADPDTCGMDQFYADQATQEAAKSSPGSTPRAVPPAPYLPVLSVD